MLTVSKVQESELKRECDISWIQWLTIYIFYIVEKRVSYSLVKENSRGDWEGGKSLLLLSMVKHSHNFCLLLSFLFSVISFSWIQEQAIDWWVEMYSNHQWSWKYVCVLCLFWTFMMIRKCEKIWSKETKLLLILTCSS